MKTNISSLAYVAKQQKHAELLKTVRNGKTCYFVKILIDSHSLLPLFFLAVVYLSRL